MPTESSAPAADVRSASGAETTAQQAFKRVLIPVADASKADGAIELARRAGATEARLLHLNLHENIGGKRFALETESSATYIVEAAIFKLQMAGIGASGKIAHTLVDRAAEAIIAEAVEWGADLIVLGHSRRGEFATRLGGSVTLRVLQHAPCPVLVAHTADAGRVHRVHKQHALVGEA
jgi:nucleotide-binding universal stress UspA family protein